MLNFRWDQSRTKAEKLGRGEWRKIWIWSDNVVSLKLWREWLRNQLGVYEEVCCKHVLKHPVFWTQETSEVMGSFEKLSKMTIRFWKKTNFFCLYNNRLIGFPHCCIKKDPLWPQWWKRSCISQKHASFF